MKRKRVVLLVVEGASDEVALQVPIANVFDQESVFVQPVLSDITSDYGSSPSNFVKKLHGLIKEHTSRYRYKKTGMALIIHLMDLDGAYVPDEAIKESPGVAKTVYIITEILASNRKSEQ